MLAAGQMPVARCPSPDVEDQIADERPTERSSAVSAAPWTDGRWPFTVERGEPTCIGPADDPGVLIVTDKGDMYAMNPPRYKSPTRLGLSATSTRYGGNIPTTRG